VNGTGTTFVPGDAEAGWPLRVIATFTDGAGTQEQIVSQATLPVENVNDAPTGPVLTPSAPQVGDTLTADEPVDADGTHNDDGELLVDFAYQWQVGNDGTFTDVPGATGSTITVTDEHEGRQLRAVVTYTDVHGTAERAVSEPTAIVPEVVLTSAPTNLTVTAATSSSVLLSWAAPASDGNSALMGYGVQVLRAGEVLRTIDGISTAEPRVEVSGLEPGTSYTFRVFAVTLAGAGEASDAVPAETTQPDGSGEPGGGTGGRTGGDTGGGTGGDTGGDTGGGTGGDTGGDTDGDTGGDTKA